MVIQSKTEIPVLMKEKVKRVLHATLGDYQYWVVFSIDLPQEAVEIPKYINIKHIDAEILSKETDEGLQKRVGFDGPESQGFGLYVSGRLAAIQWYWWGERYWSERNGRSWRLAGDEVKSVGLYTVPEYRGQGYATLLKRATANEMARRGFRRIYSRIWHSHKHSIAVSRKAGWSKVGSYVEVVPFGRRIEFRLPF